MYLHKTTVVILLGFFAFASANDVDACEQLVQVDVPLAYDELAKFMVKTTPRNVIADEDLGIALKVVGKNLKQVTRPDGTTAIRKKQVRPGSSGVLKVLRKLAALGLEGDRAEAQGAIWYFEKSKC